MFSHIAAMLTTMLAFCGILPLAAGTPAVVLAGASFYSGDYYTYISGYATTTTQGSQTTSGSVSLYGSRGDANGIEYYSGYLESGTICGSGKKCFLSVTSGGATMTYTLPVDFGNGGADTATVTCDLKKDTTASSTTCRYRNDPYYNSLKTSSYTATGSCTVSFAGNTIAKKTYNFVSGGSSYTDPYAGYFIQK